MCYPNSFFLFGTRVWNTVIIAAFRTPILNKNTEEEKIMIDNKKMWTYVTIICIFNDLFFGSIAAATSDPIEGSTYIMLAISLAIMAYLLRLVIRAGIYKWTRNVLIVHMAAAILISLDTILIIAIVELIVCPVLAYFLTKKYLPAYETHKEEYTRSNAKKAEEDKLAKKRVQKALGGELPETIIDAKLK